MVVSAPLAGHFDPMIPLALELSSNGHEVVVATGPDMARRANRLGLGTVRAGPPIAEAFQEFTRRAGSALLGSERWKVTPILFVELLASPMVADLMEVLSGEPPDLIIHEPAAFAGPLVARLLGVPSVCHHWSAPPPGRQFTEIWDVLYEAADPLWDQWDCPRRPVAGMFDYLLLCLWPSTLWDPAPSLFPTARRLRPTWLAEADNAPWVPDPNDKPSVYVTFGTVGTKVEVFQTILEALYQEDLNGVLTVGPTVDPETVGKTPRNVRVERYIPQSAVLPHVDAVACHGGSGTVLGALAYGRPLLCLPSGADHFYNADSCQSAGAGRILNLDSLTVDSVGTEIRALLDNTNYRLRAETIKTDILSMPSPREWIQPLEWLASEHTLPDSLDP